MNPIKYENYPFWVIIFSNLVSTIIYGIGAFIVYKLGIIWLILYLLYIAFLEIRLLRWHCTVCYYYGKECAFGKGKLSSLFFKKGNPQEFCQKQLTWEDLIPDFLVSIIPVVIGIILLIRDFNWLVLSLMFTLILLSSAGTGYIRTSLACKHCKQLDLGCPAAQLFNKKK
jgi:hypothetical protein